MIYQYIEHVAGLLMSGDDSRKNEPICSQSIAGDCFRADKRFSLGTYGNTGKFEYLVLCRAVYEEPLEAKAKLSL